MQKAAEYHAFDNVLPFIVGIVHSIFETGKNAKITVALAWNVEIVNCLVQRYRLFVCCEDTVAKRQNHIRQIKIAAQKAFKRYQASKMLTQKWHAFDHICDETRHVENVETLHAGAYVALHKRFRAVYFNLSCRKRSAMDEESAVQNDNMIQTKSIFAAAQTEVGRKIIYAYLRHWI